MPTDRSTHDSHRSPGTPGQPGDGLQVVDRDAPIFVISVAAKLAGMHPQTLRTYDRMGLVEPRRTRGRGRRYSPRDVAKLRLIQKLSQDEGINLQGIRHILQMQGRIEELEGQVDQLTELLRIAHSAPAGARVFTASQTGDVRMGPAGRGFKRPRAIGR